MPALSKKQRILRSRGLLKSDSVGPRINLEKLAQVAVSSYVPHFTQSKHKEEDRWRDNGSGGGGGPPGPGSQPWAGVGYPRPLTACPCRLSVLSRRSTRPLPFTQFLATRISDVEATQAWREAVKGAESGPTSL